MKNNTTFKTLILLSIIFMSNIIGYAQQTTFTQKENTVRIMSYNIKHARGMDDIVDCKRIAKIIMNTNPEVVALQEVDSVAERSGKIDIMAILANETRMYPSFSASIPLQGGKYGNGILTKEKPIHSYSIPLPGADEARSLLVVELEQYVFCCTHLSLTEAERIASIHLINSIAKKHNKPIFLAGDLNADPESNEIKTLSTNWELLNNTKLKTFPSDSPTETIDYIAGYKTAGHKFAVHQSRVIEEKVASDHRPLFVDVRLATNTENVMRTIPYLQNPSTDEITVMWLTNVPCRSWVEYGTDTTNMVRVRTFLEGEMVANNKINSIRLGDLKPNTKYYYRAVSQEITKYSSYNKSFGDTVQTPISSFTTWNDNAKDMTVVVYNDIHSNMKMFDKLHNLVKDINYDFIVFNGDCFDDLEVEDDIVARLQTYSKKYKSNEIPSIFMRGNHETRGEYSGLLWNYLGRMNGKTYSAFNFGDTRFVLLDCGEDKPDDHWVYYDMNDFTQHRKDQAAFLEKEMQSKEFKKATKRVLIHHIPIYGKNLDEYTPCKDLWHPILSKANFNVSLNAHTHQHEYLPKGKDENNYPVVIGGGNKETTGTVMILKKVGPEMTLKVLDIEGKTLLDIKI